MAECAAIIKNAALHIDSESGLVHLATSMGVKSIVLFGPTNAKYFVYQQNINLIPSNCNNCWWLTDDWMAKCPRGLAMPECLDSILPENVVQEAVNYLFTNQLINDK